MNFGKKRIGNTTLEVERLGFGTASLGNLYQPISDDRAAAILDAAWANGFRYFDTAPHYGQGLSERRVGDALRRHPDDYILSSKVGRLLKPAGYANKRHGFVSPMPFDLHYDYSYSGIMRSFEDSLQRLGLDRIDILFVHDIGEYALGEENRKHFPIAMTEGYRALAELRADGRISAIGLGVNEYQVCEAAMDYGDWDCFLLAGRYTLLEQNALESFLPACQSRNCSVIIGGAYNSGILATGVSGDGPFHFDYGEAPRKIIDKVARIEALCDDFAIPLPAAALQFPVAHPAVACVIPGISRVSQITVTLDLFTRRIPDAFWVALKDAGLLSREVPTPASNQDRSA